MSYRYVKSSRIDKLLFDTCMCEWTTRVFRYAQYSAYRAVLCMMCSYQNARDYECLLEIYIVV
jgi:hypothetical protein